MSTPSGAYGAQPWHFGSECWPGVAKTVEECGELAQALGKLLAVGPDAVLWDGSDLRRSIEDEIADVRAALEFLVDHNPQLDRHRMTGRRHRKVALFEQWHEERQPGKPDEASS